MAALAEGPHDARVERIELRGPDGAAVPAIHAVPEVVSGRGIVLHPDIMGIRPLFDDLARRLATYGFAVCAPEPFARAGKAVLRSGDVAARFAAVPTLDDDLQIGDLVAAADHLRAGDGVTSVELLGFCMGGMQVLKAAATRRFSHAAAFYGMVRVPEQWVGARLREPLASAPSVCPTLAVFGGADRWTPAEDVEALRRAWSARPDCSVVVYPDAEHGFVHDADRPAHRAADAADAWRRVLELFGASPGVTPGKDT